MSRRRRKKVTEEEGMSEAWLLPYADLLTLLLALFIVLFAMSSIDAVKFQSLAESFNGVFHGGDGVFEMPSPIEPGQESEQSEKPLDPDYNQNTGMAELIELEKIAERINTYIIENELAEVLSTSLTEEGLLITIHDSVLFDSGSAEVRIEDERIAGEISDLLVMEDPRDIVISGHTDNVPISTSNFADNWELSVMRSVNFMKLLLANKELDPVSFSAKGFGEYNPIATNDTEAGKSKNRRVEILIYPRVD